MYLFCVRQLVFVSVTENIIKSMKIIFRKRYYIVAFSGWLHAVWTMWSKIAQFFLFFRDYSKLMHACLMYTAL